MKRVAFYTLGCKLNFAETSTIARQLAPMGFEAVPPTAQADVYVVNTCSVTEQANRKCRQAIHKFNTLNPSAHIVVTGCYAQLKPDEVRGIKGVSLVLGAHDKANAANLIAQLGALKMEHCPGLGGFATCVPAYSSGDRTRSFLKVQDGCDYRCSYCTIPLARGASRNVPIAVVEQQAREIAALGVKEVVITGVNTGTFGCSTGERFMDLLQVLERVDGIERYRISSIEPNLVDEELVGFVANSQKFLPHFHIPLQSGSNRILGLMRRRYSGELFAQRIGMIHSQMPHAFIGVDVIVGFPSETDDDFDLTYSLLSQLNVSFLHVFPYSMRPNTPAASMAGQVPAGDVRQRATALGELSKRLHHQFYEAHIGASRRVLFESSRRDGMMFGFTDNYIKVATPYSKQLVNQIVDVKLGDFYAEGCLEAEMLGM